MFQKFIDWINGKFKLEDNSVPISLQEIEETIRRDCKVAGSLEFFNEDLNYFTASLSDIERMVESCPSSKYKYISESRDCDDFVRIFRGWLSEMNLGNILCAKVHITLSSGKKHALILAITSDHKVYFVEPQNGTIIPTYGTVTKVFV